MSEEVGGWGCKCGNCGLRYRVDLNVPDEVWLEFGMPEKSGLLCPMCIGAKLEELGKFGAYRLVDLA